MKIYRDYTLERLSKDGCSKLLQNLAKCNGSISSSFCLNNGFPDESVRYMSMFFRIYFLNQTDLDKFHLLEMKTTEIELVDMSQESIPCT
jgi:hypothetical protein